MSNPILFVQNAGRGETPDWAGALFAKGEVVVRRRLKAIAHWPEKFVVVGHVPPGFPPEYALADLVGKPRPLMISEERPYGQYIMTTVDGDQKVYLARDKHVRASGEPPFEIGTVTEASDDAARATTDASLKPGTNNNPEPRGDEEAGVRIIRELKKL